MEIVHDATELVRYLSLAMELDTGHPVLIDKYLQGKEVEVDAIGDGEAVLIPGVMEHIERAGVHSGDSMAAYPGLNLTEQETETIVDYTTRIGLALNIKGLMNVQFVIMPEGKAPASSIYVLEVNPRASRTIPFISKVTGVPMVNIATNVMLGKSLKEQGYNGGLWPVKKLVGIKAPVFSMSPPRCSWPALSIKAAVSILNLNLTDFVRAKMARNLSLPGLAKHRSSVTSSSARKISGRYSLPRAPCIPVPGL